MFETIYSDLLSNDGEFSDNTFLTLATAESLMNLMILGISRLEDDNKIDPIKVKTLWSSKLKDNEISQEFIQNFGDINNEPVNRILPIVYFFNTVEEVQRFVKLNYNITKNNKISQEDTLKRALDLYNNKEKRFERISTAEQALYIFKNLHKFPNYMKIVRKWQSCEQMSGFTHHGDGYIQCLGCGAKHWGKNGASGLFVTRVRNKKVTDILLQLRSYGVTHGVSWSSPSGAIADGEDPLSSAIRESEEESNVKAENIDIVGKIYRDHKNWGFTSFLAVEKDENPIDPKVNDHESLDIKWVSVNELKEYDLLPHLKSEINQLIETTENNLNSHS